ncbi:hypothetical protein [Rhizobium sp. SSA_523]|uniref:hypothetical protein n=1 Tax=Rhizobium sp. SSA_523 TaxID=2952477 RepID=UPI0020906E5E|nr:hypothetical protein [Rhizobium sp. SSA_523]MCO5733777.1 hypothetical protein [Rhizobium sp. SSA_523]WKC24948.1 hypothetical protein QTJ18_13150 [Rhizobium sp. SSA_523]
MGFQFVHFEGFSRQGGKSGRTTDFVFSEAARRPDACPHVGEPQPPETVFGVGIEEVQARHDERAAAARDLMSNGRSRAIRKTQQTLATIIASHPFTVEEVRNDRAKAAAVATWEKRTVAWLRAEYDDQLVGVVRHVDERFCHLHAYVLPGNPMMKVSDLHPGHIAKAAVVDAGPRAGEDAKALNRRGDQAYREAMRSWQDSYHQHVGVPCGLARLGPGKRRLKRAEWHDEKRQADALRSTLSMAAELRAKGDAFTSKVKAETAKLRADAARKVDAAKAVEKQAREREEMARRATVQAELATSAARRLSGLGGAFRGFWDGIRRSKLAARLREELLPTVERWQQAEAAARAAAAAESDRRVAAEKRASVLSGSVAEIGAQRDELRARLARYEPAAVVAPVPARPQP